MVYRAIGVARGHPPDARQRLLAYARIALMLLTLPPDRLIRAWHSMGRGEGQGEGRCHLSVARSSHLTMQVRWRCSAQSTLSAANGLNMTCGALLPVPSQTAMAAGRQSEHGR